MGKRSKREDANLKRKKLKESKDNELSLGLLSHENLREENKTRDWDNEEQDYELRSRTPTAQNDYVEGLPIKTNDGRLERTVREVKVDDSADEEKNSSEKESGELEEKTDDETDLTSEEQLLKIKEEVADLASKLIENPEENVSSLSRLRKMSESRNIVTSKLSLLALIPVFKSLAPSYTIRSLSDSEKREKVTKDVARLRQFEQSLVANYKLYVDNLSRLATVSFSNSQNNKNMTPERISLGSLAVKASCELASSSLRFFNYRSEVFSILCRRLNKKPINDDDLQVFLRCISTLEILLSEDEDRGDIAFDICRILAKSIRDKKFRVDESVINIFLSLSLLNDYDPNHANDRQKIKTKKSDRVYLSKKQRKARKERKEIEDELRKAEQAITADKREEYQAQTLKTLLSLYLEILKVGSQSDNQEASSLMAPVLEGLARFGNMANLDLLGDFLEVLREILDTVVSGHSLESENSDSMGAFEGPEIRSILLCISTAFALVLNHVSVGKLPITIDLSKFVSSLYMILADLSLDTDLELSHKSLRLADPSTGNVGKPHVNVSTKAELLLRCLDFIFFKSKNGTVPSATSFVKRLYIVALQAPEKSSLAILKFVGKLTARYGDSLKDLWNSEEEAGDGTYSLGIEYKEREVELERSNGGAATLWENILLDSHYSPMVKDGSRTLMKFSKSDDRR